MERHGELHRSSDAVIDSRRCANRHSAEAHEGHVHGSVVLAQLLILHGQPSTSADLFKMLRERSIGACGTTRTNTKGFPAELRVGGVVDKWMNWDILGAAVVREVLCLGCIENGAVQILTTLNEVGDEHRIEKVRRCPRITSTNGARLREVFGDVG